MIIRHISIPGQSHLVPLNQPPEKDEPDQILDHPCTIKRILNPEHPSRDALASPMQYYQNVLNSLPKQFEKSVHSKDQGLAIEIPQKLQILQNRTNFTKQFVKVNESKSNSIQKYKMMTREAITHKDLTLTPRLITHNKNSFVCRSNSTNNRLMMTSNQGQQEQETLKKNSHSMNKKGKVLYSTGQILFNKRPNIILEKRFNHANYTYSPSNTHNFIPLQPKAQEESVQNKQLYDFKFSPIKDIINNRSKQFQNNIPSIKQGRNKKILPSESDVDEDSLAFTTTRQEKYYKQRPSSEEEMTLSAKPESLILLSNKKAKLTQRHSKSPNKGTIQISYKTSLQQLKQISLIQALSASDVTMKIPEIFAYPLFSGNQTQQQLFDKVDELFRHLQIDISSQKSIKKYSNCIVVLTGTVGLIWHFEGKVFLGGWKNEFLDQGCKHGLGLEWKPKQYAYYGQFARNKKEGIGIMKTHKNELLAGVWEDNHYLHPLSVDSDRQPRRLMPTISHFAFEEAN